MHETYRNAVTELVTEIAREREANRLPLAGMQNFMREATEQQGALLEAARTRALEYEREIKDWDLLERNLRATLTALETVERHQARPKLQVPVEVYAAMQEKIATQEAALADVEPVREATGGTVNLSGPDEP